MMYELKPEHQNLTQDQREDLWVMIKGLQDVDTQDGKINLWQKDDGDRLLKKYYEPAEALTGR